MRWLGPSDQADNERDDGDDDGDPEDQLGTLHRSAGKSAKPEQGRDDRNHEEDHSPMKKVGKIHIMLLMNKLDASHP